MKTRQFLSLKEAALSVTAPKAKPLAESVEPELVEETVEVSDTPAELVEYITNIIEEAEAQLKTSFTQEEIAETTNFIVGKLQAEALIEEIQNHVGFELNEAEVNYVFETLRESA